MTLTPNNDQNPSTIEEIAAARDTLRKLMANPEMGISDFLHVSHTMICLFDEEDKIRRENEKNSLIGKTNPKG